MKQIGFNVQLSEVPHKTMYSQFCQVPKNQPAFCPNMAWGKDFIDSQSMVDPLLNGANIPASGNSNTAQVNNAALNKQLAAASQLQNPTARAAAYAKIDKDATANAYYDDWIWDNQVNMWSTNVNYVYNKFNTDTDLTFSSLK